MLSAKDLFDRARYDETVTDPTAPITAFQATYFFLSTFSPAPVYLDQIQYPTVAHALEAARLVSDKDRARIRACANPSQMIQMTKALPSRLDWDTQKIEILRGLLQQKFEDPSLRDALLRTGARPLENHNYWHDRFWGIFRSEGDNWLGQLLMEHRTRLAQTPPPPLPDDTLTNTIQTRIKQATALWYDLVAKDHHKDRDCHFYLTLQFSYDGTRTIHIQHEGYVVGEWGETARSLSEAGEHLLIRICRQIDDGCKVHPDTEPERTQHCAHIHAQLTALLTDWNLLSVLEHTLSTPTTT